MHTSSIRNVPNVLIQHDTLNFKSLSYHHYASNLLVPCEQPEWELQHLEYKSTNLIFESKSMNPKF